MMQGWIRVRIRDGRVAIWTGWSMNGPFITLRQDVTSDGTAESLLLMAAANINYARSHVTDLPPVRNACGSKNEKQT